MLTPYEEEEATVLTLGRFVPDFVLEHAHESRFSEETGAHCSFNCICVFSDISGFTKLSDLYNEHGAGVTVAGVNKAHQGAERMRTELNRYFGEMINFIVCAGGDVVKFAGDALMAVWRLEDDNGGKLSPEAAAEKLFAVSEMCIEMSAKLDSWIVEGLARYTTTANSVEKSHHQLHLHTAVGCGLIERYIVGGYGGGHWLQTLAGPPISQIAECVDQARPGQVVISSECVAMLRRGEEAGLLDEMDKDSAWGYAGGQTPGGRREDASSGARYSSSSSSSSSRSVLDILDSDLEKGAYSLVQAGVFDKKRQAYAAERRARDSGSDKSFNLTKSWSNASVASNGSAWSETSDATAALGRFADKISEYSRSWEDGSKREPKRSLKSALQSFVPAPVLRAVRSGSATSGELRRLTILFLHLDPPQADKDSLLQIQNACVIIQREVQTFEGYLKEVTVDDKGFVAVMGFGVPPYAHDNDPERGVLCAMEMEEKLRNEGIGGCAFGITTGDVFCGSIGGEEREGEWGGRASCGFGGHRLFWATIGAQGFVIVFDAPSFTAHTCARDGHPKNKEKRGDIVFSSRLSVNLSLSVSSSSSLFSYSFFFIDAVVTYVKNFTSRERATSRVQHGWN